MIDKFIVGAGPSYVIGATGGDAQVTLSINEIPAHTHSFVYNYVNGNTKQASDTGQSQADCWKAQTKAYEGTTFSTGDNGPHNNLPPYYALYYIMRVK